MEKRKSLRRRWVMQTLSVMLVVGLVCVVAITAVYGIFCYSGLQKDMSDRAQSAYRFFGDHVADTYEDYYQTCIDYASTFRDRDDITLQFIDAQGKLAASSRGLQAEQSINTPEIKEAVSVRDISEYIGADKMTGQPVVAVCAPMIYSNGEVAGVLRYVTPMSTLYKQIAAGAASAFCVLVLVTAVALIAGSYCIRGILDPLAQITEKAGRIAGGAYGVQIKLKNNDEIGDLASTVNEMSAKIAQNEKMQTEFISSLSHELRTPLTAINGWSETLLGDGSLTPDTRRGVRIISREAKRLTEMVVELLDFTRMQDGRMTLNVEPTDIRAEFEDTVFMYSSRLEQDGLVLDYLENDDEIPEITCDAQRMRQVFLNILDNAAKHGGEGKRIEASVHSEAPWVVFRIRDFGPGIPEDEIPLVKHKFSKGSSKARGSGIGLAVCDEIVQLHGGQLILSNAEEGGTLVTVKLPAAQ